MHFTFIQCVNIMVRTESQLTLQLSDAILDLKLAENRKMSETKVVGRPFLHGKWVYSNDHVSPRSIGVKVVEKKCAQKRCLSSNDLVKNWENWKLTMLIQNALISLAKMMQAQFFFFWLSKGYIYVFKGRGVFSFQNFLLENYILCQNSQRESCAHFFRTTFTGIDLGLIWSLQQFWKHPFPM